MMYLSFIVPVGKFLEKFASISKVYCVDCGLYLSPTKKSYLERRTLSPTLIVAFVFSRSGFQNRMD